MNLASILVLFLAIGFHHTAAEPLIFDIIEEGIRAAGQVAKGAVDIGGSIASGAANTASGVAKGAIGAATGIAQGAAKTAGSIASGAANATKGAIGTATGIAQGAIGTASKIAQDVAGAAGSIAPNVGNAAAGVAGVAGSIASGFVSAANNVAQGVISVGTEITKGVINAKTVILTNPRTVIQQIAGLANNVSSRALQTVLRQSANTLRDIQTNSRSALQQSEIAARQIKDGIIELGQKQQAAIQDWGNSALNKLSNSSEDTQFKGQDLIQDVVNKHAEDLQKCADGIVSSLEQLQEKANATSERYHQPMTKLIEQVDKCAQLKANDFRGLSKCAADTGKLLGPLTSAPGAFISLKADFVKAGIQNLQKNRCVAVALSNFRKDSQNADRQIDQMIADDKKASTEGPAADATESDASPLEGSDDGTGSDADGSANDAAAADSSSSDASAADAPASDSSSSDAPAADAPASDSSSSDASAADAPASDSSSSDASAADAPASDSSASDAPKPCSGASHGQESDGEGSDAATY